MKYNIAILLATYNGEKYIREQLDSIINQYNDGSYSLDIFISDDASTDRTCDIILNEYPSCKLISIEKKGGAKQNFKYLIDNCPDNYDLYFFSDQDDVWIENKINKFLKFYLSLNLPSNKPLLIHSDLTIVNHFGEVVSNSFVDYAHIPRYQNSFSSFFENNVTGCACCIDFNLLKIARKVDFEKVVMHDWIFSIISSLFCEKYYIDFQSVLYRQHDSNVVGVKRKTLFSQLLSRKNTVISYLNQAREILSCIFLEKDLRSDLVDEFLYFFCGESSITERFCYLLKNKLMTNSKIKTIYVSFFFIFWF